ncbi:MAG: adenylyltransferase/cytidyltransferase family protein [Christensenellaceae bacterium]|jgi:glycerol-3-phosphate cytidylyltransferase
MKPYKIGYTSGVYDMFHVGHLNILKRAKELCDYLIVAVTTDELTAYKNKTAAICFEDRCRIVEAIRYVDQVVPQADMNKMKAWTKYRFDVMFVGDDWKGTDVWNRLEQDFKKVGVDIVYFPYTKKVSSTMLREQLFEESGVKL